MSIFKKGFFYYWNRIFPSNGMLSASAFIIAVVTGFILAVPYDPMKAKESIQMMMISNPSASFIRSAHYWSSQFFLIFTIIHFFEYFIISGEKKIKKGVWFRLVTAIPVAFFVMLSGFILKGDSEGIMANEILRGIVSMIPLAGIYLENFFLGLRNSLQVVYVHHAATATIYLIIIIIEHSKKIWPNIYSYLYILTGTIIVSFVIPAGLHSDSDPVIKGPWYFVGLQEILHWMTGPVYLIFIIILLVTALIIMRFTENRIYKYIKYFIIINFLIYLIAFVIGWFFRGENWKFIIQGMN
jgi:hypothetical protein